MKTYKKPITEVHEIEVVVMSPASPLDPEKGTGSVINENPDSGTGALGKETSLGSTSVWDEEE